MDVPSQTDPAPADLAENRAGRLAASQHAILDRRIWSLRLIYLGASAVAFVVFALFNRTLDTGGPSQFSTLAVTYLIFGALVVALVGMMLYESRKIRKDASDGIVEAVTGTVLSRANTMVVGDEWFPTPRSLAFENGSTYTVYYAPRSRLIVAMEKSDK